MSEEWRNFFREMNGDLCSVFMNAALIEIIDELPERLVKLSITIREPNESGFPVGDEFETLGALDDEVEAFANEHQSHFVGRYTGAGRRVLLTYTGEADAVWETFIHELSERSAYVMHVEFTDEAGHSTYREDLYPTSDEWRAIHDMDVIMQLQKNGDDGACPRRVDHWSYFESKAASADFTIWAEGNGFTEVQEDSGPTEEGRYCVRLYHEGSLDDVSDYTIALKQKAEESAGDYDGWETFLVKSS